MRHNLTRALAIVALFGLLSSAVSAAPGKIAPKYRGLTYAEWSAAWWQAVFAVPVEGDGSHPLLTGGAFGGNNRMVFLSAPVLLAGSPKVVIPVTIPTGTHLFVPIVTVECSVAEEGEFHGNNEAELRGCANGLLELASDLYAEIDGKRVKDVGAYRVESPLFRYGPLPEGNALGLPSGAQSDAVSAGYFLLLQPFSAGEHHIFIRANVAFGPGLASDAEFVITVEPPGHKEPPDHKH